MGMAQYREHMHPAMRAHRVITDGGEQPNVIPAKASVWWYFRDPQADGARRLFEQAKKIAEGAVLMTNTSVAEIGRAHVCTPGTNAQLDCSLQLDKNKNT